MHPFGFSPPKATHEKLNRKQDKEKKNVFLDTGILVYP